MKYFPTRAVLFVSLWLVVSLLWGCAPGLRVTGRGGLVAPDQIIDLEDGGRIEKEELIERLAGVDVVFIGEYHNHALQHRNQLDVIKGLFSRHQRLVIGLEVFSRPRQDLLDQWTGGDMDEGEFRREVFGSVLSRDVGEVYWPLLVWARDNRVPLLALNAPRDVTARVARDGLTDLTEDHRRRIARDVVLGPAPYKLRVARAFERHGAHHNMDRFFAAQVVWDETMAETLADYLDSPEGAGRKAVVICGNEHVYRGYGVPDRLARRHPASRALLLSPVATDDETFGPGDADFIWVTAPQPARQRPRLGIEISGADGRGLVVTRVRPGSEASRIGLRPGDVLREMDGRKIASLKDFHRAAVGGGAGKEHALTVLRGGETLVFKFRFRMADE